MKRYQAIAFLLSTAMTVGSVAPVFGASNDVFGHWAEFTITKWQNEGRIGGYEDGTFKPDKSITRAEFVRLLNSAVPTAFTSSASVSFSDVKESDWFFADVAKAVGSGVTSGFEDGTFRPGETVTRMQAAVFIAKAKGLTPNEAAANNFTDAAQIPSWAKGAVGAAVSAGYLSGYPDGSFGGSKGMTRAEAVSTLDRVLGGTSTSTQTPSQGEVDTTDRDSQTEKEETTTTANAGDMVWTSGGSGSRRSSSSSGGGNSSISSSNTISRAVEISSQKDADELEGKTLTGKATIYAKEGMTFKDVRFKGDVDIIADDSAVASAYIGKDVAVAAGYSGSIKIYFEGRTNVNGMLRTIKGGKPDTQVIIVAKTPRTISALIKALIPTRIVGIEVTKVEASAPVEVADNAKVNTIIAETGASVKAEGEVNNVNVTGDVKNIELSGSGSTTVKVDDKASVEKIDVKDNTAANIKVNGSGEVGTVAVSDSANAKVNVNDTATVGKVEISDTATANVAVDEEAKVDTVTSTSTAPGSTVTGTGTVDKIESENPGTLEKDDEVQAPPVETPDKPDDSSSTDGEENPGGDTAKPVDAAALKNLKITEPKITDNRNPVVISGVTGVTTESTWTVAVDAGTEVTTYKAEIILEAENGFVPELKELAPEKLKELFASCGVTVTSATLNENGTITLVVSGTLEAKPDEPGTEEIAVTLAANPTNVIVSNTVAGDNDANVLIEDAKTTITATVENAEEGATITWSLPDGTDEKIAFKDNKTSSPITDKTATVELIISKDYKIKEKETLTITGTYTPKATEETPAPTAEAEAITDTVEIQLVPKGTEATTVGSVVIGNVAEVDLTDKTDPVVIENITATVKDAADADWTGAAQTVTWTLEGATDKDKTGFKDAADGDKIKTSVETQTTEGSATTEVTVVVDPDQKTNLTLKAQIGSVTSETIIAVTPKDDGGDENKVEATATDVTLNAEGKGSTTITVEGAELAKIPTAGTDVTFTASLPAAESGKPVVDTTSNFKFTIEAVKETDSTTNAKDKFKVNVEKGTTAPAEGVHTVTATIKKEAFTEATKPTDNLTATFDVTVEGDNDGQGTEIKSIVLTGLSGLTKLEQDGIIPKTVSVNSSDIDKTDDKAPTIEWYKKEATETVPSATTDDWGSVLADSETTFTAGYNYKATVTLNAVSGKTFNIAQADAKSKITGFASELDYSINIIEPVVDTQADSDTAGTAADSITFDIVFTEAATALALDKLEIINVPDPTVTPAENKTISVKEGEKRYKFKDDKAPTWSDGTGAAGGSVREGEEYTLEVTLEAVNDSDTSKPKKYVFASDATLTHDLKTVDGYTLSEAKITEINGTAVKEEKPAAETPITEITFVITATPNPTKTEEPPADDDGNEGQGETGEGENDPEEPPVEPEA